ncbi:MAG: cytochrome P460 family protein [Thermodesulfobacteriota bacterium]
MKRRRSLVPALLAAGTMVVLGLAAEASSAGEDRGKPYAQFSDQGELLRPKGFRRWVFVGAPVTPNELNGGKAAFSEFHHVYIDPAGYREYKRTGAFPDGTILVKELFAVGAREASSGKGYFPGDFVGLAAAAKDSARFPNEPGNWAYFNLGDAGVASAPAQPTAACNACHQAGAAHDWVFTQFYPVLSTKSAKK